MYKQALAEDNAVLDIAAETRFGFAPKGANADEEG